jgi:hypothetical protein
MNYYGASRNTHLLLLKQNTLAEDMSLPFPEARKTLIPASHAFIRTPSINLLALVILFACFTALA